MFKPKWRLKTYSTVIKISMEPYKKTLPANRTGNSSPHPLKRSFKIRVPHFLHNKLTQKTATTLRESDSFLTLIVNNFCAWERCELPITLANVFLLFSRDKIGKRVQASSNKIKKQESFCYFDVKNNFVTLINIAITN